MMMKNESVCRRYMRDIRKGLNVRKLLKNDVMKELKGRVTEYSSSHDCITVDDLYSEFGTPEEISTAFFDRREYDLLLKKARRKTAFFIVTTILAAAVLLFTLFYAWSVIVSQIGQITITSYID